MVKKLTAQINCCFELLLVFFLPTYHYAARSKQACRPGAEETSFKVVVLEHVFCSQEGLSPTTFIARNGVTLAKQIVRFFLRCYSTKETRY
jgi:hypothetical protein